MIQNKIITKQMICWMSALLFLSFTANAQFVSSGIIDFERIENVHLSLKVEYPDKYGPNGEWADYLKYYPKNRVHHFRLGFNMDKSYYGLNADSTLEEESFWSSMSNANENKVYKYFKENRYLAEKSILQDLYVVNDSINKYQWKILSETRTIAGYNCRKAITKIHDSVVVIAFYTEQITVQSGPETFGGLPGMILGIAIPRLYTTWFAKKVHLVAYDEKMEQRINEKKAKKHNHQSLMEFFQKNPNFKKNSGEMFYKIGL